MADFEVTGSTLVPEGIWGDYVAYHVQVTPRCLPEAPEWCPFSDSNNVGEGSGNGDGNRMVVDAAETRPKCESFIVYRRFNDFKTLQASLRLHAPPTSPGDEEEECSSEISVADFKAKYALPSDDIASWFSKRSPAVVLERSQNLSLWLKDVYEEPRFQRSRPLRIFLTDNANELPTGTTEAFSADQMQPSMLAEGKDLALSFRKHLKSEAKAFKVTENEGTAATDGEKRTGAGEAIAEETSTGMAGTAGSEGTTVVSAKVHEDVSKGSAFESDDSDVEKSESANDDAQQVQCFDFLAVAASSALPDLSSRPQNMVPPAHLLIEAEPHEGATKPAEAEGVTASMPPPSMPSAPLHQLQRKRTTTEAKETQEQTGATSGNDSSTHLPTPATPARCSLDVGCATIAFEHGWRKWANDGVEQRDAAAAATAATAPAASACADHSPRTSVSIDAVSVQWEQGWRKWANDGVKQRDAAAAATAPAASACADHSPRTSVSVDAVSIQWEQGWRKWANDGVKQRDAAAAAAAAATAVDSPSAPMHVGLSAAAELSPFVPTNAELAATAFEQGWRSWGSSSSALILGAEAKKKDLQDASVAADKVNEDATMPRESIALEQQQKDKEAEEQAERVKSRQRKEARKQAAAEKDQASAAAKARARADSVNARLAAANPALAAKLTAAADEQKLQQELRNSGSSSRRRRTSSSSSSDSNRESASDSLVSTSSTVVEDAAAPNTEAVSEPTNAAAVPVVPAVEEFDTISASSSDNVVAKEDKEEPASALEAVDPSAAAAVLVAAAAAASAPEADTPVAAAAADANADAAAAADDEASYESTRSKAATDAAIAFMDQQGLGHIYQSLAAAGHGKLPQMACLDLQALLDVGLKKGHALKLQRGLRQWAESYAQRERAEAEEATKAWEDAKIEAAKKAEVVACLERAKGSSEVLSAARVDASTAAANADRLGKLAQREASEAATAAAELQQALRRNEVANKDEAAAKVESGEIGTASDNTSNGSAATSAGVDSPVAKRTSDFMGLSSVLSQMPCSIFASDPGYTVCGPRARESEAAADGAAETSTQDQGSVLQGLPSVEAQASVLLKLKTAQAAAAVLELKLRGDYRDAMKGMGVGAGASVALELDRAWSSVVPKATVKVLGTPGAAAQIVACDSSQAMSRLLGTFPTKQGAALVLELYRRGAGSLVLEALASEKPAAAAALLSTLGLPPSSSKSSSGSSGSDSSAGGERAALLNGFESVNLAAAVLGRLSSAEMEVILNAFTDDKRAEINKVLDSGSPQNSSRGGTGIGAMSDTTSASSTSASSSNEVSEISSAFRAACGYGTSLNLIAFKALVQRLLLVPSSKTGANNAAAAAPSEKDLEAAFALADDDKSGGVDEREFVALFELAKQGAVKGLGKKSFFGAKSSTQKKQASAFQASFQEERNKKS